MAEQSDLEKTEPASPRRLEKAREEGDVARSRELVTFVLLATGAAGLWFTAAGLRERLAASLARALRVDRAGAFDPTRMTDQAVSAATGVLPALAPALGLTLVAALVAPVLLGGWMVSTKRLLPDFGRLDPLKGLGRLVSLDALAELVKAVLKLLLVGGVAAWVIAAQSEALLSLMGEATQSGLEHAVRLVAFSCAAIVASLLLIASVDVPWQLWRYHQRHRMSREDLRQEQKESDGDPHVKAQIRRQQQAMARRRMMSEVPRADIVVTNPTHFAVALRYRDGEMGAPRVVAKGTELVALRIRELAREHGVPLLEAPPLTRALYRHCDLGAEIPAALYTAVAEVLAWAFQLHRWRSSGGAEPRTPRDLPVPAALDPAASPA
ncbi:flagellar biosynthesis protein FlhB [Ramlibacter tataouinensis]|uniref:flagellar biosynthesis protein FlhB n=1 Tax=Ramlibacter tataouinensis TaxID=94132 RepID=UPI0022F3F257|nr:flagellar biosynthesis protein FlhB [Ramlibacter tataouinensis]WBY00583.1 flagellar biosynthesis protein FlhB [Ramlibacter tataouinensis]